MWWFSKKYPIVFVDRNRIVVYKSSPGYPKILDIPTNVVNFLEIYDPHYFEKLILSFLTPLGLKEEVIIVLSNKITFYSKIDLDTQDQTKLSDFFKMTIPLIESNTVTHSLTTGQSMYLTSNNRYLLFTLQKCFQSTGSKVKSFLPEIYVELIKTPENFAELSSIINSNQSLLQKGSIHL